MEERLNTAAASVPPAGRDCFLDRELSWLQFNLRVLREAEDPAVPLLERLKYLEIYQNNLDEFFMVRVGAIIHRSLLLPEFRDVKTGWDSAEELKKIFAEVRHQQDPLKRIYRQILKDLRAEQIEMLDFRRISKADESLTRKMFAELRQMLSPRIVDAEHPMPFLENRSVYMAVLLEKEGKNKLGLVDLFRLPAYRLLEAEGVQKVVSTDEMVRHFAPLLFKHYTVKNGCTIRVTRNADVFIDENNSNFDSDFRISMEKLLKKRRRQEIVRLELGNCTDSHLLEKLEKYLKVPRRQVFSVPIPLRSSFSGVLKGQPELKFPEQHSIRTVQLRKGEYFRYLEQNDLLLSFPFQSMTPFIEMLYEAADDPEVVSIRITLYRLAASSKLAAALAYAADQGKDVLCLLELRARFDEKNNIDYSEVLEEAGCSVIYGLPQYKVHSKLCLITRRCGDQVKYITQVGTGNYNEVTSEQYCDLSLITSDEQVGRDAAEVFEALALGQVPECSGQRLIMAPSGFRSTLLQLMRQEQAKGPEGFISFKVNSINDLDLMNQLIACSCAGVTVEGFVRGICCLRPGLKDCSERIRIRSVIGRYLEHSRIFVFGQGEQQRIFIGSGDLLNRNTQRRVEAMIEVKTPETRAQVLEIMAALRRDDVKGWDLCSDGSYAKAENPGGESSQDWLYSYFATRTVQLPPAPEPKQKRWFRLKSWLQKKKNQYRGKRERRSDGEA